ncbi:MAG: HAD family phosphatase [Candidatus Omnitrophica bacterium]|nr:HAD family phosphatase [Candidatus Omnitrophota bacterium]
MNKPKKSGKIYDCIVFDLGNTLIRFDHNISANKIAGQFNVDAGKIYQTFFDSGITRPFERGHISPREFHRRAAGLLGFTLPYMKFVDIWNDIFWEDTAMCDLARRLKKEGYKLFLLSNISKLHFEYINKKFDIMPLFDELILSYKVGAIKPERKIFDEVVKRAGGKKEGLFYIDDRDDLVTAALELGIDSVRFEGVDKLLKVMKRKGILSKDLACGVDFCEKA